MLPRRFENYLLQSPKLRIRAANGKYLKTRGAIELWIRLGKLITKERFLISDDMPVPVILGTSYQNENVNHIRPIDKDVQSRDGSILPIRRRVSSRDPVRRPASPMIARAKTTFITRRKNQIKLSRKAIRPAKSQTFVRCTSRRSSVMLAEGILGLATDRGVLMTKSIIEVEKNVPFNILVANFSNKVQSLPKICALTRSVQVRLQLCMLILK